MSARRLRRYVPTVQHLTTRKHVLLRANALSVSWHDVQQCVPPHDHDFLEIALITAGRGEHISSRRRTLTAAGDLWVIRPGHWHTYMNVRRLGVYNCLLSQALLRSLAPALQQDPGALELIWRGPASQARDGCYLLRLGPRERLEAERMLDALRGALALKAPAATLAARGHLWLFLSLLAGAAAPNRRGQDSGGAAGVSAGGAPGGARLPAAVEAVEIIEAQYREELTVAELARTVGVSTPHLARLFRRLTGLSPMRYLAEVRAQRACRLLAESSQQVTQIAGAVGWPDPNLFARRFKALLGVSPSAYRSTHGRSANKRA